MDALFEMITFLATFHYLWLLWRHVLNDCPPKVSHRETDVDHLCWDGNRKPGPMEECSCAPKWQEGSR